MNIRIEYCVVWNYKPRALSLRDDLSNQFGNIVELKPGAKGAFEVFINNQLIFSKINPPHVFPEHGEIISLVEGILNVT